MQAAVLIGRVLISAIFLREGYGALMAPRATMAVFAHLHVPLVGAAYALAVVVELAGGAAVLAGWKTRIVAPVMAAWCLAMALALHPHPDAWLPSLDLFRSLNMAGGLLLLWANGPGRYSLDRS